MMFIRSAQDTIVLSEWNAKIFFEKKINWKDLNDDIAVKCCQLLALIALGYDNEFYWEWA